MFLTAYFDCQVGLRTLLINVFEKENGSVAFNHAKMGKY